MDTKDKDQNPGIWMFLLMFLVMMGIVVFVLSMLPSCTSTITMVHTDGNATDVVDETATNDIKTSLEVPIQLVPQ